MRHKLYLDDYTQVGKNKITLPKALADYYGNTATAFVGGRQVESKGYLSAGYEFDNTQYFLGDDTGFPSGNSARTLEFWFANTQSANSFNIGWGKAVSLSGLRFDIKIDIQNNLIGLLRGGANIYYDVPPSVFNGESHHFAITSALNDTLADINFYVDGFLLETVSSSSSSVSVLATDLDNFGVNYSVGAGSVSDGGSCKDVRVWNYQRTQDEIKSTMYMNLNGNETGLVAYYQLLNDYLDHTGSNDLTATGTPTLVSSSNLLTFTAPTLVREIEIGRGNLELASVEPDTVNRNVLSFDGINDKITIPAFERSMDAFGLEFFVKFDSLDASGNGQWIIGKKVLDGSVFSEFQIVLFDGNLIFEIYTPTGITVTYATSPNNFSTGRWYHFAMTFEGFSGGNFDVYVDGARVSRLTPANTMAKENITCTLGMLGFGTTNRYFDGRISDVRFWSKYLTQNDIGEKITGNEDYLDAWYKLDNTLSDSTSNNSDATNSGATFTTDDVPIPIKTEEVLKWTPSTESKYFFFTPEEAVTGMAWNDNGIIRYIHRACINDNGTIRDLRVVVNKDGTVHDILS